jgi:P27 family predicted phage terminase small subunit
MGRKPEKNRLKVLTGSRYQKKNTPKIKPEITMWRAPKMLGKHGKIMWKEVGPILIKANIMCALDKSMFMAVCHIYDVLIRCIEDIEKDGFTIEDQRGSVKKNPVCTIFSQYLGQFKSYCKEFGLTPDSRDRLGIPDSEDFSEWDKFADPVEAFRRRQERKEFEALLDP